MLVKGFWGWNLRKIRDRRNNRILTSQESFTKIESILLQMGRIITPGALCEEVIRRCSRLNECTSHARKKQKRHKIQQTKASTLNKG